MRTVLQLSEFFMRISETGELDIDNEALINSIYDFGMSMEHSQSATEHVPLPPCSVASTQHLLRPQTPPVNANA